MVPGRMALKLPPLPRRWSEGAEVVLQHAGEEDGHGGEGTNHDGVHKYLKDAEETLLYRLLRIGTGMGDGSGTKASLVGEDTAGYALFHAHEEASHHTAGHGSGMESTFYNRSEYSRYSLNMEKDHTQCQHDIHDRHERNQLGGDIAIRLIPPIRIRA